MASPSDIRYLAAEDTEVTSEDRHQQLPADRGAATRKLDLEFPLVRQSSIYSLTLDEIQNAVCEPGKTFGSMNMDEFLTNIWNAEEVHAAGAGAGAPPTAGNLTNGGSAAAPAGGEVLRQGSLTLPAPLCRKTVDEVWVEIHHGAALRSQQQVDRPQQQQQHEVSGGNPARRQPTLGEMTMEDFLVKAGVVREGYAGNCPPAPVTPPQQHDIAGFHQQGVSHAPMPNGYGINGSLTSPGGSSEGNGGGQGDASGTVAYGVPEGGGRGGSGGRTTGRQGRPKRWRRREAEEDDQEAGGGCQLLDAMSEQARANVYETVLRLRRANLAR